MHVCNPCESAFVILLDLVYQAQEMNSGRCASPARRGSLTVRRGTVLCQQDKIISMERVPASRPAQVSIEFYQEHTQQ